MSGGRYEQRDHHSGAGGGYRGGQDFRGGSKRGRDDDHHHQASDSGPKALVTQLMTLGDRQHGGGSVRGLWESAGMRVTFAHYIQMVLRCCLCALDPHAMHKVKLLHMHHRPHACPCLMSIRNDG